GDSNDRRDCIQPTRTRSVMTVTDELLRNNERFAESFDKGDEPLPPARKLAVVACMDARLHVSKLLGLDIGDAHIIRNAGGVVSDVKTGRLREVEGGDLELTGASAGLQQAAAR